MLFVLALWVGWYAWLRCPRPEVTLPSRAALSWHDDLHHPWRVRAFRRLMGIFVLSGMASAVAATLVIFFIQDLLQAPAHEPLFLGLYFLAAAMSMPMWMRSVRRWGLARSWLGGMGVSVLVFVWAMQLGAGNVLAFGWVCVLSGAALGADLAIPSAMLASVIAQRGDSGTHEGAYFGWWTLASKLNLALAAGLTLPLLAWLGYQPANATPQGLQALSLIYALVPCALKLMAGSLLYVSFVRESSSSTSHFSEAL